MKSRTVLSISTLASILAGLTPMQIHADPAMDACIKAFVEERVPKDRAIKIRKLEGPSTSLVASQSGRITLTASGAKSGTRIASATCVVSEDGDSVALYDAQRPSTLASAEQENTGA
jgi:hypothetical protein